jgi:hypothetical protein
MAFTMACPNFKKGLKMAFGPLGVKAFLKTSCLQLLKLLLMQLGEYTCW